LCLQSKHSTYELTSLLSHFALFFAFCLKNYFISSLFFRNLSFLPLFKSIPREPTPISSKLFLQILNFRTIVFLHHLLPLYSSNSRNLTILFFLFFISRCFSVFA